MYDENGAGHIQPCKVPDHANATAQVAAPEPPRASDGKFTGAPAIPALPLPMPLFQSVAEAEANIQDLLQQFADEVSRADKTVDSPHFLAIAASPGAGKSKLAREAIAAGKFGDLAGNIAFYVPTLALAEEAQEHFLALGVPALLIRGRSAKRPNDKERRMCARHELAEEVAAAGFPVYETLCQRRDFRGRPESCRHFTSCAYIEQLRNQPKAGAVFVKTHAQLVRDSGKEYSDIALRVIDESPTAALTRQVRLPLASWIAPRQHDTSLSDDALAVARRTFEVLDAGLPLVNIGLSAVELRAFAETQREEALFRYGPASAEATLRSEIHKQIHRKFRKDMARAYDIIAECLEQSRTPTPPRIFHSSPSACVWCRSVPAPLPQFSRWLKSRTTGTGRSEKLLQPRGLPITM